MRAIRRLVAFNALGLSLFAILPTAALPQDAVHPRGRAEAGFQDAGREVSDRGREEEGRRDDRTTTGIDAASRRTDVDLTKRQNAEFHDVDALVAEIKADEVKAKTAEEFATDRGLTIFRDGYDATWVRSNADTSALARIEKTADGVDVTDINRRNLPIGTGSDLLATGLKAVGVHSGEAFRFRNITNKETLQAHDDGVEASDSLLGKLAAKALEKIDLAVSKMDFQKEGEQTNLVVRIK